MQQHQLLSIDLDSRRNRHFSEPLKRKIVSQIIQKQLRVLEAAKLYKVSRTSIYNWIYRYSELERGLKTVVQMESESHKTAYYQQQLAELERLYGQKQIELDYLNKLLELASAELGYDLKKKHGFKRLNGSAAPPTNTDTK